MSLAPIATDDPGQLQLEIARLKRVAEANRKRLRLFKVRPEAPRGVNLDRGYISWEEPRELSNVTHYNIYADDDTKLFRRVPVGQTRLSDIMPDTKLIWVSAFNEESGLESIKKLAGSDADPDVSGENPITGGDDVPAPAGKPVTGVAVTYESQSSNDAAGSVMNRLKVSWARSGWTAADLKNCTGYAVWGKSANADGSNQDANYVIIAVVDDPNATAVNSPWLPTATTDKKWTVWVMTRNKDGILNPVATAPSASTTVPKGVGSLDLRLAWNFDPSIFDATGPTFTIQALSADLLKSGTIKLGGSGVNKPGNMFIYDYQSPGVESFIGWVGAYSGYYGAWFKNLWVGGTNPSDANIRCVGGNLSIYDAAFTVTRAGYPSSKLYTGPATFDPSYSSSVSLFNEDGTDRVALVTRGLVFYKMIGGGWKQIGAYVRSPNGGQNAMDLEFGTLGGAPAYVLISGNQGVRSDQGYYVGSNQAIDASNIHRGAAYVVGASTLVIDANGAFVGKGVSCPNNGVGALGFNPWNGTQYLNGQTGTFTTGTGKVITVTGGVITNIPAGA